jgi:predicted TIM-barrel fold metal-dependent hydrolase
VANTATASAAEHDVLNHTIDVDSHEMAPTHVWGEMFGENSSNLARAAAVMLAQLGDNSVVYPDLADRADITEQTVWTTKGPPAPGAFDFKRRLEVLDLMGTQRQLVFPTSALLSFAMLVSASSGGALIRKFGLENSPEVEAMLWGVIREYNDWALRTTTEHPDRYRAATLVVARTVDELMAQATDLAERGARALWLPGAMPPAGRSPADHDLDPFWSLMEDTNVAVTLHIGTDSGFRATDTWARALPEFEPVKLDSAEITFDPFTASTVHMVPANYLTAMVMGGVFERHPRLRFGALELGSSWLGPLAEHLDVWAAGPFRRRMSTILTMPPSEYIARNVRVTPFYFEPIDLYLERHAALQDCYCYSTDYPHQEGGADAKARLYAKVKPLGDDVVRKFFASNGEWLLPA